jgi:hypothetical protein
MRTVMADKRAKSAATGRKRPIVPTTCESDDVAAERELERELEREMEEYRRETGRMDPSWSEVLGGLGCE